MQSWVEKLGGHGTEPRDNEAAPDASAQAVADDGQADAREQAAPEDDAADASEQAVTDDDAADAREQAAPEDDAADASEQAVTDDDAADAREQAAPEDDAAEADDQPLPADLAAAYPADPPTPAADLVPIVTEDSQDVPDVDATAAADEESERPEGVPEPYVASFAPAGAATVGGSPSADEGSQLGDAAVGEADVGGTPAPVATLPSAAEATQDSTVEVSPEPGSAQGADIAAGRWPEIQAMFVDDPRASVELAADLVDDSLDAFVASVKRHQGSLRSMWDSSDADTEQLRKALQRYRGLWRQLHSISTGS